MTKKSKARILREVGAPKKEPSPFDGKLVEDIDIQEFYQFFKEKKGVSINANQLVQILFHQVVKLDQKVRELEKASKA